MLADWTRARPSQLKRLVRRRWGIDLLFPGRKQTQSATPAGLGGAIWSINGKSAPCAISGAVATIIRIMNAEGWRGVIRSKSAAVVDKVDGLGSIIGDWRWLGASK
jgi:hypothetical protein